VYGFASDAAYLLKCEEARNFAQLKRIERTNHGVASVSMDESFAVTPWKRSASRALPRHGPGRSPEYVRRMELVTKSETVSNHQLFFWTPSRADNLRPRYLKDLASRLTRFALNFGDRKAGGHRTDGDRPMAATLSLSAAWPEHLSRADLHALRIRAPMRLDGYQPRCRGAEGQSSVNHCQGFSPGAGSTALEASDTETLPYWAARGFLRLRTAELERLSWADVHFEENVVEVPSLASKTASRRFVPIRPNLVQWLEPYRDRRGPLCPT